VDAPWTKVRSKHRPLKVGLATGSCPDADVAGPPHVTQLGHGIPVVVKVKS
jgi:hypothetical protein